MSSVSSTLVASATHSNEARTLTVTSGWPGNAQM
jgi:hypothetical protein